MSKTLKYPAATGQDIIARWCNLAERRLDYLTDLYDSDRWQRYFSEPDFVENVREARTAVDTWRQLVGQGGTQQNLPVNWSWLDRPDGVRPPSASMSAPARILPADELAREPSLAALPDLMLDPMLPLAPTNNVAQLDAPDPVLAAPQADSTRLSVVSSTAETVATQAKDGARPVNARLYMLALERYPILRLAI